MKSVHVHVRKYQFGHLNYDLYCSSVEVRKIVGFWYHEYASLKRNLHTTF